MAHAERRPRVAIGSIFHETSQFLTTTTDLALWRNSYVYPGEELYQLRQTACEVGGMLATCEAHGAEVIPLLAARCVSGGPNTDECYQSLREMLLTPLVAALPVDGVLLSLHGSMTALSEDDPEGDILEAVRTLVGPNVPVVATLDLHAHVTARMVANATGLVAFTHYPHDDAYTTGERGAQLLFDAMSGATKPVMAIAKVPILCSGINGQTSGDGPMAYLTQQARLLEQQPGILSVSIFHVQPTNDLPDLGCGALVIADSDLALATEEAMNLADAFWQRRFAMEATILTVAEAVERGRQIEGGPILLIDTSDCTGGGAAGDSVALLRQLLAMQVQETTYVMVVDPEAAEACAQAGIGSTITLRLGHKIDPSWGDPLPVTGVVRHLFDGEFRYTGGLFDNTIAAMGLSAVLRLGSFEVLIMSKPTYDWADEQYRAAGLDTRFAKFIGVKNPSNYQVGYGAIARGIFVVDTPGPTPPTVRHLPYRRMKRPFFPLDEEIPGLVPALLISGKQMSADCPQTSLDHCDKKG